MAEQRVRVAMVGAGSMANAVHYPSLASLNDVEIAAICDLDAERMRTTADKYGIERRYADFRKMVEEVNPDAVYAIGHPHIMYDVWTWLLEHKQNLFIEKPMGITVHQAQSLAYLAERNGCVTQVGFQRRSSPLLNLLREECLRRGPITHAVCEFYKWAPQADLSARSHMMDDGVHALDTLRWMCGGEVAEVASVTRRVGTPDLNFFTVLVRFDNGATGLVLTSWTSGRRIFRVEMHAQGICAEADHEGKGALYADGDTGGKWYDAREVGGGSELYQFAGFRTKSREFIDCVRGGGRPSSCFADAVKTITLADTVLAQALLRGD